MGKRHLIFGLAMLLLGSLASPCLAADDPSGQSAFVVELARKAILSVKDSGAPSADRPQRLSQFLDRDFDMPRIAAFVAGRYWQKASDSERQTFTGVYRDFMAQVYSQRFARYDGESFVVVGQRPEGPDNTIVYTEMNQPAKGAPLKVEWRVSDNGGYRVTDVSIAGISMAITQREEFAAFLSQNGGNLAALIQRLQAKIAALEAR